MKYIQKIAFVLVGCLSPLLFGSCDDWLTLLPEDRTVEEDFWKNRSQVESVVMSCYRLMQEDDVLQRIVWWGEMRSDNVVAGTAAGTDEKQLMEANILSSNSLTRWDGFYEVINVCNRVIERAPEVLELDNNFGSLNPTFLGLFLFIENFWRYPVYNPIQQQRCHGLQHPTNERSCCRRSLTG
jgi:hypothetical protein